MKRTKHHQEKGRSAQTTGKHFRLCCTYVSGKLKADRILRQHWALSLQPGSPNNNCTSLLTTRTYKNFSPSWSMAKEGSRCLKETKVTKERGLIRFKNLQGVSKIGHRGVIILVFKRRSKFKNTCRFLLIVAFSRLFKWPTFWTFWSYGYKNCLFLS